MMINFFLLSLQAVFVVSSTIPTLRSETAAPCSNPSERPEWRTLTNEQRTSYLDAVKCLQTLPANGIIAAAKTRFDDFQGVHVSMSDTIHFVGQFLPYHRYFLWLYEKTMREECGYTGVTPYWDWTIDVDAGEFVNSPLWDPDYGFGGDGTYIPGYNGPFNNLSDVIPGYNVELGQGGGCITDGPFASYNLSLGPGTLVTNHCIQRGFNPSMYDILSTAEVNHVLNNTNFHDFWRDLEGALDDPGAGIKLHGGAHLGIGGEMTNSYSSPGDPIFYLHHAALDRVWWRWQQADPSMRLHEISGQISTDPPVVNVTLDYILQPQFLGPAIPIRDIMNIQNELLCYVYV